ncbi:alpha/beta-hydrolase [Tilletiaria anomala UBC 951]|uniref:Carboxypeptidase n=1 Tax=Tilletiaria anomala (strain ATCC 24038 / CBS 436.72 / UBC 951) TaxID=1037660 RepID=A0A066VL87_TILAU|nr:alpha/beta-hydrolase [Tilletiaria anomala UBC 951]KDN42497.1 alpha/beta-hydrolase [Tilletiaria anomala UBC 951]
MRLFTSVALLGALLGGVQATQIPFLPKEIAPSPVSDDATFTTLQHPALPAHTLRITEVDPDLCERKARSFSGYMDVDVDRLREHYERHDLYSTSISETHLDLDFDAKHVPGTIEHFYFWAFDSRNDPNNDPHVLWLNGGPGCSSFTGLLMELGPCNAADFTKKNYSGTEWNPFSFNSNATMIFLDQPTGVGFSYVSWADPKRKGSPPGRVYSTPAAARDASAFLQLLNLHAPDIFPSDSNADIFKKSERRIKEFHIAGESYAGRYIPLIAAQLLRDNEEAARHPERGLEPVPLRSLLIGNGITSPKAQYPAYVTWSCTNVSGAGPFLDKKTCDDMYDQLPACSRLTEKCANSDPSGTGPYDNLACTTAATFCEEALSSKWDLTNTSIYDYEHKSNYDEEGWVAHLLNLKSTKEALGVDKRGPGDAHDGVFIGCSDAVGERFATTGDGARDSTWAVKEVLNQGIRVLAYSGGRDFICNWVGNEEWTSNLDWVGGEEFRKRELEPWHEVAPAGSMASKGRLAGHFRNYANLTFAIVDASGHFVPHDQPVAALTMVNRWLHSPANGRLSEA